MAQPVDHAEIKTGQLITIAMAVTAYVLKEPSILAGLSGLFLITALYRPFSPFVLVYHYLIRPLNLLRSDYRLDNIQPHSFGQFIGAVTAAFAAALLYGGYAVAGWSIVWILVGLTFVSYRGWCIGCYFYYRLNQLGLRGFFRHKPTDDKRMLGSRPGTKVDGGI